MSQIKLIGGNSNPQLVEKISRRIGIPVTDVITKRFSDGETFVQVNDNIRGADVFIIQSTSKPANDHLMECLLLIDACKRASCGQITVVMPYYGYARFDKRQKDARQPISAKLVADLVTAAGAHRVLTMEMRTSQVQGFFDIPLDHLQFNDIICRHISEEIACSGSGDDKVDIASGTVQVENPVKPTPPLKKAASQGAVRPGLVIVAAGKRGTIRGKYLAERLGCSLAVLDGRKGLPDSELRFLGTSSDVTPLTPAEVVSNYYLLGEVRGCDCVIVDDIIDSARALCEGCEVLLESGAKRVFFACVHAVLSEEGIERLKKCPVQQIICSNSIECSQHIETLGGRLKVLDASGLFSEAIRRIHFQETLEEYMAESM
eukprot:c5113_g1_i2.p1 GENE.c5113_g1_i2~~c5113_g1_i2.p1  ORF type:complete len:375 (+),score=77.37 c5113_g1_i2:33-1157(+)